MKQLSFFSLLLAATMFFGCGQTIPEVEVEEIKLDKTSVYLIVGQSLNLTATIYPSNATNQEITWSSSNPSVAKVYYDGRVFALSEGNVVINAMAGNKTAACEIRAIKGPQNKP